MPVLGVVLGSLSGIALTSFSAFDNRSVVDTIAASLGYQIHALPSLAAVVALLVSAVVTVTASARLRTQETAARPAPVKDGE